MSVTHVGSSVSLETWLFCLLLLQKSTWVFNLGTLARGLGTQIRNGVYLNWQRVND